jgi:hypothetical protein
MKLILVILIVLIIGLLIAIITRIIVSHNESKSIEISTVKDYNDLKSGDLVFVSYKNLLGQSIRALSASEWSHVGMIYKESPEHSSKEPKSSLYILEIADYRDLFKGKSLDLSPNYIGVIKIPYDTWLKFNKHHDIYFRKLNTEDYENKEVQNKILQEFSKLQKYKQQKLTDILELKRLMFFESYDEEKIQKLEKITCIELVVMLLQNLELMEKEAMPSSFYPCDLASNVFLKNYGAMKKMS